ncbi:uncharacterized protein F5Z01DRAFT_634162 [Emericellopsis atlantica]|uniref:BTB domain-containing protein n=1 Tax=Emericellopsis atlantica TaxID=2614577 RepID=A0A9P7ZRY0_9HYPO|nr:uncharacterized protein F5Z01DRAFT_634162 [Emericellopsis atlantica]KAG9256580.1 hypothetical protein F5Z01DRAFT_634162 [Emericellopsis atlantica]
MQDSDLRKIMKRYQETTPKDLVIVCGSMEYHVHKLISALSPFFQKACEGEFKVFFGSRTKICRLIQSTQEAREGRLHLPDDDPRSVDAMVQCAATGSYQLASHTVDGGTLLDHVKVWALGQKYELRGFRDAALGGFRGAFGSYCRSYNLRDKETASAVAEDLMEAVDYVYTNTVADQISSTRRQHDTVWTNQLREELARRLARSQKAVVREEARRAAQKHHAFAFELLIALEEIAGGPPEDPTVEGSDSASSANSTPHESIEQFRDEAQSCAQM